MKKEAEDRSQRVNFDMPEEEYQEFKKWVEKGNSTISKILRSLVRDFVKRANELSFGRSVVEEHKRSIVDIEEMKGE